MSTNVPPSGTRWHSVEVTTFDGDGSGNAKKRTVEGDDVWCAAALRALADQLDPPKPPRPGLRDVARDAGSQVRRGQGGMVVLPQASDVPRNNPMSLQ